jgi:transposase InsO family protein
MVADTATVPPSGPNQVWRQLRAEGHVVAKCAVERLMRQAGLVGVIRGAKRRTTFSDPAAVRPPDLVNREFKASRPNALWVVDFERHEALLNRAVVTRHRLRLR